MRDEQEIRREIFEKIAELHRLRKTAIGEFIPGTTPVLYGGRVYDEREIVSLVDASLDFWLTTGRYAAQFEHDLASFLGLKYCILTNSGSSANLLAVSSLTSRKLGKSALNPGDEVITTACGFPTTLNPVIQNGLTPVFVDVELGTYNIDTAQLQEAISRKTRAMIIPHTLGNPANLDCIVDLAEDHDLWFIEDNCDALGSEFDGRYTGTFGDLSTCSFYPAHHITMGEGGAVLTDDPILKRIVTSFRDWGRDCWCEPGCDNSCNNRFGWKLGGLPSGYDHKYIYSHIGYNLKVTDMQAAVGVEQLKKLPGFIRRRKENFRKLDEGLQEFEQFLQLPRSLGKAEPSWFGYPVLVKNNPGISRDSLVRFLEAEKISTRMLFGGNLLKQPAYEGLSCRVHGNLENSDTVLSDLFWIGVYPGLDQARISYTIEAFQRYFSAR
jgi:CDP-6-deoxy-D-xylo-4-hexulose-3-dehydrase